ncbi:hypothetical protein HPCPY3281_0007 [Helicobacter pylori CPY3281]|nr:hypothetical protein HPCPY3281_0007 [Helicobacter pylori CPY3281]
MNDSRIDPFSSFETINNRGKDLSTLELLKTACILWRTRFARAKN